MLVFGPVGWGCRIYRLHLCRRVRPVEMFQCSFISESSLKIFQQNSRLNFLSAFELGRILVVDFRLILLLFPGRLLACLSLPAFQEASDEIYLLAHFSSPRIRSEGSIVVLDKKDEVTFGAVCMGFLLPLPLWPYQVCTWLA